MKVLETVLSFFLTLAQVIFPRKRKPSPSDRPCPPHIPKNPDTPPPLPPTTSHPQPTGWESQATH